ncbi:hypothetical protein CFC21_026399, partial [Triticum aestivum]
RRRRGRGGGR